MIGTLLEKDEESKLHCNLGRKSRKYIEYDEDRLRQSIVFFIRMKLKNFQWQDIYLLEIDLETCLDWDFKSNGCLMIVNENICVISISTKNISKQVDDGFKFKSYKKSLFYVILHEIFHYLYLIFRYKQYSNEETLKEFFDELQKEKGNNTHFDSKEEYFEYWSDIPEEVGADMFAFENLTLFENLYKVSNGYLIGTNLRLGVQEGYSYDD